MQMDAWEAVKADTYRQYGEFTWQHLFRGAVMRRTFRAIVTMRLCQGAAASRGTFGRALPVFRVLHHIATHRAAIDLPWRTEIGGGLALTHAWGLAVSQGARMGRNVTLFHGVTVGQRDRISPDGVRSTGYPVLEDDVWVGPNAIIVGELTIGRGSRIGGGAFVTDSIPAHSVVTGNPACIVRDNCMPDVSSPAPTDGHPAECPSSSEPQ
jgi:serine O-acetyltransferase